MKSLKPCRAGYKWFKACRAEGLSDEAMWLKCHQGVWMVWLLANLGDDSTRRSLINVLACHAMAHCKLPDHVHAYLKNVSLWATGMPFVVVPDPADHPVGAAVATAIRRNSPEAVVNAAMIIRDATVDCDHPTALLAEHVREYFSPPKLPSDE